MNWFYECRTFKQGQALYKKLCKIHHPDLGGDTATMQDINSQWSRFKKAHRPSPGARPADAGRSTSSSSQGPRPGARPADAGRSTSSSSQGPRERKRRYTRFTGRSKAVHMPTSKRRHFTRIVELVESTYTCVSCFQVIDLDWYPGSWKPSYCPPCRKAAAAAANRARQQRYRDNHKK